MFKSQSRESLNFVESRGREHQCPVDTGMPCYTIRCSLQLPHDFVLLTPVCAHAGCKQHELLTRLFNQGVDCASPRLEALPAARTREAGFASPARVELRTAPVRPHQDPTRHALRAGGPLDSSTQGFASPDAGPARAVGEMPSSRGLGTKVRVVASGQVLV